MEIRKFLIGVMILCCANAQAFVEVTSFSVSERDGTIDVGITLKTTDPSPPASIIPSVFVDYTTVDGTARDENTDGDYVKAAGKLEFTKFETQIVKVEITNDFEIEGPEAFSVQATIVAAPTAVLQQVGNTAGKQPGLEAAVGGVVGIEDEDTELEVSVKFPGGNPVDVNVTLICTSGNIDPPPLGEATATKMTTNGVVLFELINYLPGVTCIAFQPDGPPPGYTQQFTDCNPDLSPDARSCSIVNVPIVAGTEAIPVLDRFALTLLILLMLGSGAVGIRRFI
jgi:hypothetical protein